MNTSKNFLVQILFIALTLSIVTIFSYPTQGEELSGEQKEIWKMEEKLWKVWKKERAASLQAFYHKEAIIWGSNITWPLDRTLTTANEYFDARTRDHNPIESFELTLHEIRHFGNVAVVQYDAEVVSFLKRRDKFRISNSWIKQDGKWVIIGAMYNSCSNLPRCTE